MIEKLGAVLSGFISLQFPQFYYQYMHVLKGHTAELKYQISLFEQAATLSGKTLPEWVAKFLQSSDPDFSLQGQLLQSMLERLTSFQQAQQALESSSVVARPFIFTKLLNKELVQETWSQFQWGFNFGTEAIAYGGIGAVVGYAVVMLMRHYFRKLRLALF